MIISLDQLVKDFKLEIKGVIHIGAHYGQEYSEYKNLQIENLMFFEPLKNNFEILRGNIPISDNISLYQMALGNITGQIEMFVETANCGMSSSILEADIHLKQYPHITFDSKELVNIDKLDNIEFDRNNFNMINIDVQGYELEVFKGASDTLNSIDIVYAEVNNDSVYKNCALVDEIDLFLSKYNFKRVLTNWIGGTWGDAIYLKNNV